VRAKNYRKLLIVHSEIRYFVRVQGRRSAYGADIHTLIISRINTPKFGVGLKFEPVEDPAHRGHRNRAKWQFMDGHYLMWSTSIRNILRSGSAAPQRS